MRQKIADIKQLVEFRQNLSEKCNLPLPGSAEAQVI